MKASLFGSIALALAVASACGKHNEVDVLHHEAVATAKYYAPRLDALDARVQAIFQRGSSIPASTPGIPEVGARLTEARDTLITLKGIASPGADGKSAVEKQADAAAKDGKLGDLTKLVHDTETTLERGVIVINTNLTSVESWISYFDRQGLAMPPTAQPANPGQPETPAPTPAPTAPTAPAAPAPAAGSAAPAAAPAHP